MQPVKYKNQSKEIMQTMTISNIYRNRTLNEISEGDVGAELKVAGWIENIRDHGGVSFIDLRDM